MNKESFLTELFDVLNHRSIDYFVFGEYRDLPRDTGGSDIDLYVSPDDYTDFLRTLCFLVKHHGAAIVSYYVGLFRIAAVKSPFWGVQIDVFQSLYQHQGRTYYPANLLQGDIIKHRGIRVLDSNKGFYCGFLKEVLHNATVKEKYVEGFRYYLEAHSEDCLEELKHLYGSIFSDHVSEVINGDAHYDYKLMQREMRRAIHDHDALDRMANRIRRAWSVFCPTRPNWKLYNKQYVTNLLADPNGGGILLKPLFDELGASQVRYSVLRNWEYLPESTGGSDVDVWCHADDVTTFREILGRCAEGVGMKLVSGYEGTNGCKLCYANSVSGVQFDLFIGGVYCNNVLIMPDEVMMNNTFLHNNVKVLDTEAGDVLAYIKELLYNKSVKDKYTRPLEGNPVYTSEKLHHLLKSFSDEFILMLSKSIQEKNLVQCVVQLRKKACTDLKISQILPKMSGNKEKLQRIGHRPGYVIVVEGTDGSGKTTIIDAIVPWLNEAFHNGVVYNHLRPNMLPDIGVLLGKRKKTKGDIPVTNPHEGKPSGLLMSLVRWGYYMIDYTFGFVRKVLPAILTRSKVFIFDRYYYDYYVDQRRMHTSLPRWLLRFGEFFIVKPDLILCLGGDPQKIYERKPETSLAEVKRQTEKLKELSERRKNAVWIDTTQTIESSVDEAMTAIVDMMSKHFNK